MVYFPIVILLSLYVGVVIVLSSKVSEGYAQGFVPYCPGSTKPAKISRDSLKYIGISVLGDGNPITASLTRYSYFQTKLLAKDPNTDFKKKTLLFAGGYLDSPKFFTTSSLGSLYKRLGYNVWSVDITRFVTYVYPLTARLLPHACKHVAEMLVEMTKLGLNPKRLELIGDSLGGQSVGFIAKSYKQLTGVKVARVTGLDPAGPCFRNLGPENRLDKSDADFVDVIHTNIDGYGMPTPLGHVDFYVNGGEYQQGDFATIPCTLLCSHLRAFTLWLAAMQNPTSFIAMKCDSVKDAREKNCYDRVPLVTNIVGLKTNKRKTGIFYLATNNTFPYYLGGEGLRKENDIDARLTGYFNKQDMIEV